MANKKYDHLIKPLSSYREDKAKKKTDKPKVFFTLPEYEEQTVFVKGSDLEGIDLAFDWGFKTRLGDWHSGKGSHVHPYPEVMMFVGLAYFSWTMRVTSGSGAAGSFTVTRAILLLGSSTNCSA